MDISSQSQVLCILRLFDYVKPCLCLGERNNKIVLYIDRCIQMRKETGCVYLLCAFKGATLTRDAWALPLVPRVQNVAGQTLTENMPSRIEPPF